MDALGERRNAGGHSAVEVTYDLTALTGAAVPGLAEFARGYPDHLRSWQDAIAALLDAPGTLPRDPGAGH